MRAVDSIAATLVLCVVLSSLVIFTQYKRGWSAQINTERSQSRTVNDNHNAVLKIEELRFLKANYSAFTDLTDQNTSKAQRRVSWIELLEKAKIDLQIAELSFDIYPRRLINNNQGMNNQTDLIAVGVETLVLRASLLHEGIIPLLTDYLRRHSMTPFIISAFEIKRIEDISASTTLMGKNANVLAEFTIQWYSLDVLEDGTDVSS